MKNLLIALTFIAFAGASHAQNRTSYGVNLGFSYNSGGGYRGGPAIPYNTGAYGQLTGIAQACGGYSQYRGGYSQRGGYAQQPRMPYPPPVRTMPMAPMMRRPNLPRPNPMVRRGPMPYPTQRPQVYPGPMPMGPCIVCSNAVAQHQGYYSQQAGMSGMYRGGGQSSTWGGVNINMNSSQIGGGNFFLGLGAGISANTTNVTPYQPQRFFITQIERERYPVFYGGQRQSNLAPRPGHNPFN